MTKAEMYPSAVYHSEEDEGYIAIALDLPGCTAFGETQAEAISELDNAKNAWLEAAEAAGNPIPPPSPLPSPESYSGKLLVRMPRTLHKTLSDRAKSEGVSLNHLVVYYLTSAVTSQRSVKASSAKSRVYLSFSEEDRNRVYVKSGSWPAAEGAITGDTIYGLAASSAWARGDFSEEWDTQGAAARLRTTAHAPILMYPQKPREFPNG